MMWKLDNKEGRSWIINAFGLRCWKRLLRVPWTAWRSNQSILKEINPEFHWMDWCWSWSFSHPRQRANSLEKTLTLGKIEGNRRRGWQRMKWLDSITDSMDMNVSKLQEIVQDRGAWHAAVHLVTKSRTWLSYWTATNFYWSILYNSQDMKAILVSINKWID